MFERFTDRARKVMALANQEAQMLKHEYIAPEHILLGLIKEGSGVGANVLKNLGIDLFLARKKVMEIVPAGPNLVTYDRLPQTPNAKKVIEETINAARDLNHNYVGTEHILMGILRTEANVAVSVLESMGLTKEAVREEIIRLLGPDIKEPAKVQPASQEDLVMALAKRGHAGQKRSNGSDYINHPVSVRNRLIDCGIRNKDVLNTALCHDLLEDTSITEEEIKSVAGEVVLEAVKQLTNIDPPGKKRDFATKTKDMLEHAKHYGDIAKMVKLADRYDNLADAVWEWEPHRVKRYAQAGLALLDAMTPLPEEIAGFAAEARRFFSCLS